MAITRVQGNARGIQNSGITVSVTLGSTPIQGNVLILVFGLSEGTTYPTNAIASIAQTGVSWSLVIAKTVSAEMDGEIWLGVVGAGASKSITITLKNNLEVGAVADVCEYSGLAISPIDKTASANGSDHNPKTGTTTTTTQANELWIGCTSSYGIQSSPENGFTLLDGAQFSTYMSLGYLEKIVAATGVANSGVTTSDIWTDWSGCIATFKAASATLKTVTDSISFSDSVMRHKSLLPVSDAVGLADAVLRNKTFSVVDSVGASDVARTGKNPLIVSDAVSLVDLVNVITGAIIKTVADAVGLADVALVNKTAIVNDVVGVLDQVFRHKPSITVSDAVYVAEVALVAKLLIVADSLSLVDAFKVLKTLIVLDTVSLVDAASTPSRILQVLDSAGLSDNAFVNKALVITENVSLVEVVQVGTGGVAGTSLYLVIGNLVVDLKTGKVGFAI